AIANARAVLEVASEWGSLDAYVWSFVQGAPKVAGWQRMGEIPAETEVSRALSRDLKRRGFRFVGPTVCYAFMQAVGLVNDHTAVGTCRSCTRWPAGRRRCWRSSSGSPSLASVSGRSPFSALAPSWWACSRCNAPGARSGSSERGQERG